MLYGINPQKDNVERQEWIKTLPDFIMYDGDKWIITRHMESIELPEAGFYFQLPDKPCDLTEWLKGMLTEV